MTSAFLSKLRFEDSGGFPFTLTNPLLYYSESLDRVIEVPAGFETDLASIPGFLWWVLPKVGPWDPAAVIHDYLYRYNGVERRVADRVMHEAMKPHVSPKDVPARKREYIYLGVRMGGWLPWRRYRKADGDRKAQKG